MRILIFLIVCISLLSGCVQPFNSLKNSEKGAEKAKIVFNKTMNDFGNVNQNDEVGAFFWAKNIGNCDWIISDIETACDCTTVNWPHQPILPGDSARIDVLFNSQGWEGKQIKSVTIHDNSEVGKYELIVIANILIVN